MQKAQIPQMRPLRKKTPALQAERPPVSRKRRQIFPKIPYLCSKTVEKTEKQSHKKMKIELVSKNKKRFLPLLLLADEQESMIGRYLERGDMFVMYTEAERPVSVAVVTSEGLPGVYELKNLAVSPDFQHKGYGSRMISHICLHYSRVCHTLTVGTGENPQTIRFYRKQGFAYSHTVPNFFTEHYDHPIVENGKRLKDMIYFSKPVSDIIVIPSVHRNVSLLNSLTDVWETSVRHTHNFLTEKDIQDLVPEVKEALLSIETLWAVYGNRVPVGFMGVQNQKIEMLFLAPEHIGKGLGKRLVELAFREHDAVYVDVNEQNIKAADFYRHMGFRTFKRNECDGYGNPFPILEMKKENKRDGQPS